MYRAVQFSVNAEGIAISYSLIPYEKNFVLEVKNKGHKTHLAGFKTQALAEATANSLIGTVLAEKLPDVQKALREGDISQASPNADADSIEQESDTVGLDDGLQSGNGGDQQEAGDATPAQ